MTSTATDGPDPFDQFWSRMASALADLPADAVTVPPTAKVGAVLVLVRETEAGPELVLTRRRDDMRSHPGQVSFPGGRRDPGETVIEAALREATEEIALDPASVEVIGRGPVFYIPPSRFWVAPVLARWTDPHPLRPSPGEVDRILHVPLAHLVDQDRWRSVPLSAGGGTWAWQLDGDLLWGATAITVSQLLDIGLPGWHEDEHPAGFPEHRQVRPWESMPMTPPRNLLEGDLPTRSISSLPVVDVETMRALDKLADEAGWSLASMSEHAGRGVAHAMRRLLAPDSLRDARITALVGPGGNGAGGLAAIRMLAAAGADVSVILLRGRDEVAVPGQLGVLEAAGIPVATVAELDLATVSPGDGVVDAMVGLGASPPLHGTAAQVAEWLRAHHPRVVAVDLPSGLGGDVGLRGPGVTADVTVTVGLPKHGLTERIVQPYVGDLYLADLGIPPGLWARIGVEVPPDLFSDGPLVRLVPDGGVASDAGTPDQGVTS
jgi:hydroxyethylthiazole kinase-like uncharacterized protein yjeF